MIGGQEYIDKYDVSKAPDVDLSSRYGANADTSNTNTNTSNNNNQDTSNTTLSGNNTRRTGCGGCGSSGTSGTSRYSYSVGDGGTSSDGVTTAVIASAAATTSSLTNLASTDMTGKEIEIPSDIKQGPYTVTGYDYWIDSGKEMTWQEGTNQRKVSEIWKEQGSVFKNGIAVINVDGVDRYLVAVSTKFGQSGDCIDVTLEDGTVIPCIIGDSKGSDAKSEWGHVLEDGSINVLEFEVQREKYLQSGNPTTEKWNLPWDSSKAVKSIKNTGSIIGATKTDKTVVTNNTDATATTLEASANTNSTDTNSTDSSTDTSSTDTTSTDTNNTVTV